MFEITADRFVSRPRLVISRVSHNSILINGLFYCFVSLFCFIVLFYCFVLLFCLLFCFIVLFFVLFLVLVWLFRGFLIIQF